MIDILLSFWCRYTLRFNNLFSDLFFFQNNRFILLISYFCLRDINATNFFVILSSHRNRFGIFCLKLLSFLFDEFRSWLFQMRNLKRSISYSWRTRGYCSFASFGSWRRRHFFHELIIIKHILIHRLSYNRIKLFNL